MRIGLGAELTELHALSKSENFVEYLEFYGFNWLLEDSLWGYQAAKIDDGEFELAVHYFTAPKAKGTIILLHGYFDHVGLYKHIIRHCLETGHNVLALDLPGHGLSSGACADIDSFDQYSSALSSLLELSESSGMIKPLHLLGQSTGAAIIINSLQKKVIAESFPIQSFILLAPLIRPYAWTTSRILYFVSKRFVSSTRRNFSVNSHDEVFLNFLKEEDPLQCKRLIGNWIFAMIKYQRDFGRAKPNTHALEIIQGTADTTVDWKYNMRALEKKFPNSTIRFIDDARHHLVNESDEYRTQVLARVSKILSSG